MERGPWLILPTQGGRENYISDLQWRGSGGNHPVDRRLGRRVVDLGLLDDSPWSKPFGFARIP
jgi:hypothetical protein